VIAQRRHFPLITGVRGLAAVAVLLFHAAFNAGIGQNSHLGPFVEWFDVAVPVFLVISGFLLYRPFVVARRLGEPMPSLAAYGWQRIARIVPAYWVALTVFALWLGLSDVFTLSGIPIYYGFGQIYSLSTIAHGIPQAWSLGVEMGFYVFLAVWVLLMSRRTPGAPERWLRRELVALAALFLASLFYKLGIVESGAAGRLIPRLVPTLTPLPGYLDMFALGMALAVLSVEAEATGRLPTWLRPIDRWPGLAWGVAGATFIYGATLSGISHPAAAGYTHAQFLERHYLYTLLAVCVVLPTVFGDPSRGLVRRFLGLRAVAYLGTVSYGIYLYHMLALALLYQWGFAAVHIIHPYLTWSLGGLLVTLIPASLSWYLLERPATRLRGRWRARRREREADAAGTRGDPAVV
jgi:peptidoglycan/LPS O-acetylase OafA/YrhL